MKNDEVERLIAALSSQIGDDVSVIFNHESLFKRSRDLIRTQAARIAELEEALSDALSAHRIELERRFAAEAALSEMTRRRDEWRKKAEGFDAVRLALREKVGTPWPPHMSRLLWAGIAADEKKRADDAEAEIARLTAALAEAEARNRQLLADHSQMFSRAEAPAAPKVEALVEALRWYASQEAWTIDQVEGPHGDYGNKARAALAALEGGDA